MNKKIERILLEYIFPQRIYCVACGALTDRNMEYSMCGECFEKFQWARGRICEKCGKLLAEENPKSLCRECAAAERNFDKGFACFAYGSREKKSIMALKYKGKTYVARELGKIMADRITFEIEQQGGEIFFDEVIPIPIHKSRMRERGFNQAELLAKYFSDEIGVSMDAQNLYRKRKTVKMSGLSAMERSENIEKAFGLKEPCKIKGKRILLIDDIFTTGSTAEEAAGTLKKAGAKEVYIITAAAGADYASKE